jgi:hypothetical protein
LEDHLAAEIHAGAVDFLLGHELAHVFARHLRDSPKEPEGLPQWLHGAFEAVREIEGLDGQHLIKLSENLLAESRS